MDINKKPTIKIKSQNIVGVQSYINSTTGELEEFTVINKNITRDFNFHKIWLQDVLNILDSFGNKKIQLITTLLKLMRNEDNTFSGTYREFADMAQISIPTVHSVMNELIKSNIIRRLTTATYQFNPDIIVKGNSNKRQNLLIKYNYYDKEVYNAKHISDIEYLEDTGNEIISPEIPFD